MSKHQLVYALSSKGYFPTSRDSNHPSITLANERNVHLDFIRCNELFKGESKFQDPIAEQFFKASKSLPHKSKMMRSQITNVSSACNDEPLKHLNELSALANERRRTRNLVARSFHSGKQVYRVENPTQQESFEGRNLNHKYEYQEIKKLKVPQTFQQFEKFKSETLVGASKNYNGKQKGHFQTLSSLTDAARLQNSYHIEQTPKADRTLHSIEIPYSPAQFTNEYHSYIINTPETPHRNYYSKASIEREQLYQTPKHGQNKSKQITTYTVKLNQNVAQTYAMSEPQPAFDQQIEQQTKGQSQLDELNRLRRELAKRDRQIREFKHSLQMSEKKNKNLQKQIKTMNSKLQGNTNRTTVTSYSNYSSYQTHKMGNDIRKQMGGNSAALLYFTLFIVLLTKSTLHN